MIRTLEYKGEKLPFKFGFYALKHFKKEAGKNFLELKDELEPEEIEVLFWLTYLNGCLAGKSEGWSAKYKREDAEEILDELFQEFVDLLPLLAEDFVSKKKSNPTKSSKTSSKKA